MAEGRQTYSPHSGLDLLAGLLLSHLPGSAQQHVLLTSTLKVCFRASSMQQAC